MIWLVFLSLPVVALMTFLGALSGWLLPRKLAIMIFGSLGMTAAIGAAAFCTALVYVIGSIPEVLVTGTKYAGSFVIPSYVYILIFLGFFLAVAAWIGGISAASRLGTEALMRRHSRSAASSTGAAVVYPPAEERIVVVKENERGELIYLGERRVYPPEAIP